MAIFDIKTFLRSAGQGQGFFTSLGLAFGFPSCLFGIARDILNLIPSKFLRKLLGDARTSKSLADATLKKVYAVNRWISGIIETTTDRGPLSWLSDSSQLGSEMDEGTLSKGMGGFIGLLEGVTQVAGEIYTNYENVKARISAYKNCLKGYHDYLKYNGGLAAEAREIEYFNETSRLLSNAQLEAAKEALDFQEKIISFIADVESVLAERRDNPSLEPEFTDELCFTLSGLGLRVACPTPQEQIEASSVFRLVFGPPKSSTGQFILSKDGLYFDSQVSGLTPALIELVTNFNKIPQENRWKFDYNSNLGGRGDSFSTKDLNLYVNTILDQSIIDESPFFQNHYDMDGILQDIIGQRSKRLYDLSAQVQDLISENAAQSLIFNFKQSLMSENATHQERINKRKKQIELAVKLPTIYGNGTPFMPGQVPLNDFSYLEGINFLVDIQKQKALTLSQVDISSVISPIRAATYVVAPKSNKNTSMEHLLIANLAEAAIIYDGSNVLNTSPVVLDVTNRLTTDGLIAAYNFLQTDVEEPSSTKFLSRNSASKTDENYCQLVSDSLEKAFARGLAVPYLHGITNQAPGDPKYPSSLGSFIKLPDSNEFNDLLYSMDGASIDFWTHVPNLASVVNGYDVNDASGLYRLVLANENVGFNGQSSSIDTESISNNFGDSCVRGFIMGFSRDRRITSNEYPSNNSDDNPVTNSVFFIAPTQSVSTSSAGLINRAYYDTEMCSSGTAYHCMASPVFSENKAGDFYRCDSEFCHIVVTFDRIKDEINFYLDGAKATTSSMSYVFGIQKHTMPNIPNFKKANSFEYNVTSVGPYASKHLQYGPKLNTYFTPWIIGGGYTDGMYSKGNFMGGKYGGIISGLKGYIGSMKFYKKVLSESDVLNNFNTQKPFFKNIDTVEMGWEPIYSL